MATPPTALGRIESSTIHIFDLLIFWYNFDKGHVESDR